MKEIPMGCVDRRLANCPMWYLMPPKDINMRIPDNLKKCVVFIGVKTKDGQEKYIGTGFLIAMRSKISGYSFVYIVTARHVAVKFERSDISDAFFRMNLKIGGSAIIREVGKVKWHFHPDSVFPSDVAATLFWFPKDIINTLDFETIPIEMLLTDGVRLEQGIGEGDDVFTVGLFSRHIGNEKNLPIIRMGTIAMISDEPIKTTKFGNMEAYLIESRSIKGLSGSPVFVLKPTAISIDNHIIPTGLFRNYLLGLMHGHWDLEIGESVDTDDEEGGQDSVNVGIAIVVPAKRIVETINCKELAEFRMQKEASWVEKNSPTPD